MHMPDGIGGPKVERPQVHGFVRVVIPPMEGDADEALLEHVPAANLELDRAFGKLAAFNPRDAVALALGQVNAAGSLEGRDIAIHDPQLSGSQLLREVDP